MRHSLVVPPITVQRPVRHSCEPAAQIEDAPAEVLPAAYLAQCAANCVVIGEGVPAHRAAIQASERRILGPEFDSARAENVFTLGATLAAAGASVDPRFLVPTYIRPPEPEEKLARRP